LQQKLRPYVTAGIALVGASLVATTPMRTPPSNVQQRPIKLVDHVDYDVATPAQVDWSGLESIASSSHWVTDPDLARSQHAVERPFERHV
jgi:hypothetical protein